MTMTNKFPIIENADETQEWFTLIVFSENLPGTLNQVTSVFTRRQMNIESLNVSASGIDHIHRYTITVRSDHEMMKRVVKQIEKKIDVIQARFYREDEIYIMEQALFKIPTSHLLDNHAISKAIRTYGGSIVEVNPTYAIVSKEGLPSEIRGLYTFLKESDALLQYVNSGIVAVTKSRHEELRTFLEARQAEEDALGQSGK